MCMESVIYMYTCVHVSICMSKLLKVSVNGILGKDFSYNNQSALGKELL